MNTVPAPRAVFFDLDGTLVDSAPDMVDAMRRLRAELGMSPQGSEAIAAVVSRGGRAMMQRGLPDADAAQREALLPRFLELYSQSIARHAALFPGMPEVLQALEHADVPWGIVTNKPGRLARALLQALALDSRCAALVCGDCLAQQKPHPEPLWHACRIAGVAPGECVYVGDDLRDIQAGRAAGMRTLAAAWGYIDGEDLDTWQADAIVQSPGQLVAALRLEGHGG